VFSNCGECLEDSNGRKEGILMEAIQSVATDLGDCDRNVLGDMEKRMKKLRKAVEDCRRGPVNEQSLRRMELLKFRLERLEEQKNLYWRQRAKTHWLAKGDRNTCFFHQYASERRNRSWIKKSVKDDGSVVEEDEELQSLITNYYRNLFTTNAGDRMDELL